MGLRLPEMNTFYMCDLTLWKALMLKFCHRHKLKHALFPNGNS